MHHFSRIRVLAVLLVVMAAIIPVVAHGADSDAPGSGTSREAITAVGTAFTFQGRLSDGGNPANGNYDLQFYLYDAASGGSQVGPSQVLTNTPVSGGLFTVRLDFGSVFHGGQYYLETQVRPGGSAASYTVLTPRQALGAVPNAQFANEAASASSLQGVPVVTTAPAAGNVLTYDGANWSPAPPSGGGGLSLPYSASQSSSSTLFSVTNSSTAGGDGVAVVQGINNSTSGLGIGVTGTQNGSGWGVFGSTPSGVGVYGSSTSGRGVSGYSLSGTGGRFQSSSGSALEVVGPIKVSGSAPAAFVYTVAAASPCAWCSMIDNPATNGNPNAIVMVTQYYGSTAVYNAHPIGVYYVSNKWAIFNEDLAAMPIGAKFNILVINQ